MKPFTRSARFWYALAFNKPEEMPTPINQTEEFMRAFALRQAGGGQVGENAVKLKAAQEGESSAFLGKDPKDLVADVELLCDGNDVYASGTAYHVKGFEAFSSVPEEREGYYFPFHLEDGQDCSTMSIYKNGEVRRKDVAFDKDLLFRFDSENTEFAVVLDTGKTVNLNLDGMSYAEKDE